MIITLNATPARQIFPPGEGAAGDEKDFVFSDRFEVSLEYSRRNMRTKIEDKITIIILSLLIDKLVFMSGLAPILILTCLLSEQPARVPKFPQ